MTDLFDWTPPFQRHSPTSKAAAEAIKPRIGEMHEMILRFLHLWGAATDEQMQNELKMPANTQRRRRRELQNAKLIVNSGRTRATQSGRQAVVWILAEEIGK
jgi:transcription initiation factor IIE alpha subunit